MPMRMMNKDDRVIQNEYFLWLCDQIGISRTRSDPSRRELVWFLHNIVFYGFVPNDDNRAEDGKKLRQYFADQKLGGEDCQCLDGQCTVLEMMVALARRMEESIDSLTERWFWEMVRNLGLQGFSDDDINPTAIRYRNSSKIDDWLERRISTKGEGGLFPLRKSHHKDQRNVEIWYQMQAYLGENYPI
jgi:hypothetical protein